MEYGHAVLAACVVLAIAVEVYERVQMWRARRREEMDRKLQRAANAWAERCEQ